MTEQNQYTKEELYKLMCYANKYHMNIVNCNIKAWYRMVVMNDNNFVYRIDLTYL